MSEMKKISKKDIMNFKKLELERQKVIHDFNLKPIVTDYFVNDLVYKLHPDIQFVKVLEVIKESDDVKTFVIGPDIDKGTNNLAYFKAGQCISACVKIGVGIYQRPYTISCSPKNALDNKYTITIKRRDNGIVSNYFFDEVDKGYSFSVSAPFGDFCYSSIRDENHVIALAEDSGIIPFVSMAEAIYDGIEDFNLTIIYAGKTKNDLIFREKLDNIICKLEKVNVIYILSEENDNEFLNGLIDKEIIEQYKKEYNSFFVCGSLNFYAYINEILKEFNLPKKYIRHGLFMGEIELDNYNEYKLTVLTDSEEFHLKCNEKKTLLQTMEESGIIVPNKCHVGECGYCRSKLISGKIKTFDENIRAANEIHNYIHPCCSFPLSDITIKLTN